MTGPVIQETSYSRAIYFPVLIVLTYRYEFRAQNRGISESASPSILIALAAPRLWPDTLSRAKIGTWLSAHAGTLSFMTSVYLFALLTVALLGALYWLSQRARRDPRGADLLRTLSTESLLPQHYKYFPQVSRALSAEDARFLQSRANPCGPPRRSSRAPHGSPSVPRGIER